MEPIRVAPGSLEGQVAIVTGANTGIGAVTARELARGGAEVILAGRSEARTAPVVEQIRAETGNQAVRFHALDLASLAATRGSAEGLVDAHPRIDLLVNNAGLAATRGLTKDGFEIMFGVNHLGHFLFTHLLLDSILAAPAPRIVTVASRAHKRTPGIDWSALHAPARGPFALRAYAVSKLANVLFSAELSRRLRAKGAHHVNTYSLHPGVIASDLWRSLPKPLAWAITRTMIGVEEGAATTLLCATDPALAGQTGRYYSECVEMLPTRVGRDEDLAAELWEKSLAFTGAPELSA